MKLGVPVFELDRITVHPGAMGGKACIRGMRIPVSLIFDLVANGMTVPEIIVVYPDLEPEDIRQALEYASWAADGAVRGFVRPVASSVVDYQLGGCCPASTQIALERTRNSVLSDRATDCGPAYVCQADDLSAIVAPGIMLGPVLSALVVELRGLARLRIDGFGLHALEFVA